ncbi:NAD kinase [Modestobacter sp. VKM Ac-2978]|uniref:NAD kinase n=1 Tax=Modestobacter sp. VKM Ac-2978 TaxID=3004132 RepID=UPI0022AA074A|nr:NAD kinase [Modestobacter sp. VKM Ac-2978]MCZ2849665.1 NAD kinase [Modestobacter sp. VKM Ac-2978]
MTEHQPGAPAGAADEDRPAQRRVLLAVHTGRADIVGLARSAAARLAEAGIVVRLLDDEAEAMAVPGAEVCPFGPGAAEGVEIVLVFGGDGTFLRAAEMARSTDAAITGVNLGRVGFLAETEPEAVEEMIAAVQRCEYDVEERLTLEATVLDAEGRPTGEGTWALNEISVEKVERARVLDVVLEVDGHPLTSFGCDGVLCATPTGSTAYAFSAGGPVVWPDVEALLLVPTNAHALFARPLVTSPTSVLTIAVPPDGTRARVSADGRRVVDVPDGGRVEVRRSERPVRIARMNPTAFGDRLVAKFGLPVRGFRDARSHGPGHEAPVGRTNVLTGDVNTSDGVLRTAEEVGGGHPDSKA